ncbi:MAG: type II toxin-antitoxin system prevent-host-death family antitoxin [Sphingomonas sp.]|uniref:type II toxin-antitoxin system Phd/YefM family antitoxin n=1 Tax=Sphingomonas sp. TaxID=28214 RepID=UPI001B142D5C|nr:type II toxin-antitoxin system prevent-host-death family antitoxin [Sphingomonas sp.]MBO9624711.1 type II toxin-antitoxin system prevent-host-death family antitoxin [Sphingomonas sp.]
MEMSVREARANFAAAIEAAQKGERVVITRNGKPVAELGPPSPPRKGFDFERAERVRKELGLDKLGVDDLWPPEFDDPAFSRKVLGLDDNPDL